MSLFITKDGERYVSELALRDWINTMQPISDERSDTDIDGYAYALDDLTDFLDVDIFGGEA